MAAILYQPLYINKVALHDTESQITGNWNVHSAVCSGQQQRKYQYLIC